MLQKAQADSPVTQVSLTKTGFCPDQDQAQRPFCPLQSTCVFLSQHPHRGLLQGYCMAGGEGRGPQCPSPGSPIHFPFLPKLPCPLSGLQAGSRPGNTSPIPLRSSPLPALGQLWTHSGTCFGCCLFKNRLYPWD